MVYIGTGDDRRLMSADMHFMSVTECNYFAAEVSKEGTETTGIEIT